MQCVIGNCRAHCVVRRFPRGTFVEKDLVALAFEVSACWALEVHSHIAILRQVRASICSRTGLVREPFTNQVYLEGFLFVVMKTRQR